MNIKKYTVPLLLVVSIPFFRNLVESKGIINLENMSFRFIKNTFERTIWLFALIILWMNELTNMDLYNDSYDIENIDIDEKVDYNELSTDFEIKIGRKMKSPFRIEYNESLENID
jgi:membrane-bound lytic murein transglycosylase D